MGYSIARQISRLRCATLEMTMVALEDGKARAQIFYVPKKLAFPARIWYKFSGPNKDRYNLSTLSAFCRETFYVGAI